MTIIVLKPYVAIIMNKQSIEEEREADCRFCNMIK
jgi:hypothetical protein